jgi:hypothetical protein
MGPKMSAAGQEATCACIQPMSALTPKLDVDRRASDVRNVPKAVVSRRSKSTLFDHLVGRRVARRGKNNLQVIRKKAP